MRYTHVPRQLAGLGAVLAALVLMPGHAIAASTESGTYLAHPRTHLAHPRMHVVDLPGFDGESLVVE
ncbi:MAG: hypothetical protein ACXVII_41015 [Solirubrobacteraceae bacterium]